MNKAVVVVFLLLPILIIISLYHLFYVDEFLHSIFNACWLFWMILYGTMPNITRIIPYWRVVIAVTTSTSREQPTAGT